MTPAPLQPWIPGTPTQDLSAALFDGALVMIRKLDAVNRLVQRARDIVATSFGSEDPRRAETRMPPAAFRHSALHARRSIERDPEIDRCWRETLAIIGYDLESTCRDRVRLRIVPSQLDVGSRRIRALPAHRDTWGSGIMAQINWWLPLHPLVATRTMLLWPEAFRRPVPNDSETWDFDALVQSRKDYPLLPLTREAPREPGVPVLIRPGELLAFSAAHLHAGTSDASGRTRFSIDTRTVWLPDVRAGRHAPNVDGAAGHAHWEWFTWPPGVSPHEAGRNTLNHVGVTP